MYGVYGTYRPKEVSTGSKGGVLDGDALVDRRYKTRPDQTNVFSSSYLHPHYQPLVNQLNPQPTTRHKLKMYIPNVQSILAAGLALTGMPELMKKRESRR